MNPRSALVAISILAAAGPVVATPVDVDITGYNSWDGPLNPNNEVLLVDMAAELGLAPGSEVTIFALGWDLSLTTVDPSYASEAVIYLDENVAPAFDYLLFTPFEFLFLPGTFSVSGFDAFHADELIVLPDGILRIEFFETYIDYPGEIEAHWSGTLTFRAVPAPGAAAVLALGGVAAFRRRRR